MAPTLATNRDIARPSVKKGPAKDAIEVSTELPLGIQLTGGLKLREEGLTGRGVRVAVIDSGVDETHPGFGDQIKQQMWFRWGTPLEEDDHGTHVAGTIHLMAPEAEICDYRVFGEDGFPIDEAIAISIVEACFDGCQVINMSLGGRWPSAKIRTAVQFAESKGVVVICAAGNEGDANVMTNERSYPAMWDEAFSIAAVGKKDGLPVAYFSNSNPQVDYAGIGINVLSFKPGGGYQLMSGTSMASPHVAGLIAALLTEGGDLDHKMKKKHRKPDVLEKILNKNLSIDVGLKGADQETGMGFLTYLDEKEFQSVLEQVQEMEA